jgi:hypothetical protein
MTTPSASTPADLEQQRLLLERILASDLFRKSPRLSAFLTFICTEQREHRGHLLQEQRIGNVVFERAPNYHVGEDSIVRSQARFLRQRLEEYFEKAGKDEELILVIPKGGYVPAFERRPRAESPQPAAFGTSASSSVALVEIEVRPKIRAWQWIVGAIALLAVLGAFAWWYAASGRQTGPSDLDARFWSTIFDPKRPQIVVPADSSLILMEEFSGARVTLSDYISRSYLEAAPPAGLQQSWRVLKESQYTNVADLNLVSRLERRPEAMGGKLSVHYARDLSLTELKESNAILIGGARANPWVELFDPVMHLQVDYDWTSHRNFVRNSAPARGEQARYDETGEDGKHLSYGVIAFLPSLDHEGSALLVGGTDKAGTEAAAEFLSGTGFGKFLESIAPEGKLTHFEVLLSAEGISGGSHHAEIVCSHRLTDEASLP